MRIHPPVTIALIACGLMLAGCERGGDQAISSEADEPYYRQGQQLVKQGRSQEALAAYLKVIAQRGESAPESHLEAGLIYLQQIKDPIAAIYHFRKYLELQPNSRQAVYVRGLVDTAKREFARTLPAQPLESQSERLDMLDQIDRLRRENEQMKAELMAVRGGVSTPTIRTRAALSDEASAAAAGDARPTRPLFVPPSAPVPAPEDSGESPVTLASEPAPTAVDSGPVVQAAPLQPSPAPSPAPALRVPPTKPSAAQTLSRPTAPPTKPAAGGGRRHVVTKGDTLFSLAQRYYGNRSRWRDIYNANRDQLPSENALRMGMELRIP
jgi:nucleoid-associated protein YgaU